MYDRQYDRTRRFHAEAVTLKAAPSQWSYMTGTRPTLSRRSRRAFLGTLAAGSVVLAGCVGGDDETENGDEEGENGESETAPDWPPVRGDPEADITLEVYEDYTCPACHQYNELHFPAIEHEYLELELIRYEHRDFPFRVEQSWQAASAARKVFNEHGNDDFWAYKSELMAAGARVEDDAPDIFGEIGSNLSLDAEAIQNAATERSFDSGAESDRDRGEEFGVPGTPAFVVNGELADGLEDAISRIDDGLGE